VRFLGDYAEMAVEIPRIHSFRQDLRFTIFRKNSLLGDVITILVTFERREALEMGAWKR